MTDNDAIYAAHDVFTSLPANNIDSIEFDLDTQTWTIRYKKGGFVALIDTADLMKFLNKELTKQHGTNIGTT